VLEAGPSAKNESPITQQLDGDPEDDDEVFVDENEDFCMDLDHQSSTPSSAESIDFEATPELDPGRSPHLPLMLPQIAKDPSLGSEWDWENLTSQSLLQQQQQTWQTNLGTQSWFQPLGDAAPLSTPQHSHVDFLTPDALSDQRFDFNVLDHDIFGSLYKSQAQSTDATAPSIEFSPVPHESASSLDSGDRKGSVTVILNQVDAEVAQEIIGGVLRHNSNLTIRLLVE
jgi:hypothetical protein